jgi:hypothetical protein
MQKNKYFYCFLLATSVLKLALVAGNEIVAVPYDSANYVRQAADYLFTLGSAPGYPFWLALSGLSGIPQRISIELLLILSGGIASCWLRKMFGNLSGCIAFALVVTSPGTYLLFDYALTDGLYACLTLVAIAVSGTVIFSTSRRRKLLAALALGVSMGWMALARTEDPLLLGWAGLVILLLLVHMRRTRSARFPGPAVAISMLVAGAIAVPAVVMVQSVNLMHLRESGVFARTLSALPGHTRLLRNLAEIDDGATSIRYVPVSAKARELAYEASPTLRKYKAVIEDRDSIFQQVSREAGLPLGEIGGGWVWHVFNAAILQVNGVVAAEVEYGKINAELGEGFRSKLLKKRFVLHAFASAPVMDIMRRLPAAAWKVAEKSFQTYPRGIDVGHEKRLFDAVTLRRAALITGGYRHVIQGWVFQDDSTSKIKSVTFIDGLGQSPLTARYMPRADVEDGFKKPDGTRPAALGFAFDFNSPSQELGRLLYVLEDGSTRTVDKISQGITTLRPENGGSTLKQGIDYATVDPVRQTGYGQRIQDDVSAAANTIVLSRSLLVALLLVCGAGAVAGRRLSEQRFNVWMFSILVAGLFLSRVLFYAVLESEAWVVEVRYMLAANFMAAVLFAVLLPFCIRTGREALRSRAAGGRSSR